jgi:hypothetical protein
MLSKFRRAVSGPKKENRSVLTQYSGISLSHFRRIMKPYLSGNFYEALNGVKEMTASLPEGNRSLLNLVHSDPRQQRYTKPIATVFVSYAWLTNVGQLLNTLKIKYGNKDVYIWIDFACVDQHGIVGQMDFHVLSDAFKDKLTTIKSAVIVLSGGIKPVAMGRSWCCFEWTVIQELNITYDTCMTQDDEETLIEQILGNKLGFHAFNTLFSEINVMNSTTTHPEDRENILKELRRVGEVKVNDIVQLSVKEFMVNVLKKALARVTKGTEEEISVVAAFSALYDALVSP